MQTRSHENHSKHADAAFQALISSSHAEHSKQDHTAQVNGHGYYRGSGLVFAWQVTRDKAALLARVWDVWDGEWTPGQKTEMRRLNKVTLAGMVTEWETPQPTDEPGWCWVCKEGAQWAVSVALAPEPVLTPHAADEDREARHHAKAVRDADYAAKLAAEAKLTPRPEPVHIAGPVPYMVREPAQEARWAVEQAISATAKVAQQLDLLAQQLDLFTSEDYLARLAK